jgi:hypothetical protein
MWATVEVAEIVNRYQTLNPAEAATVPTMIQDAQDMLEQAAEELGYAAPEPSEERRIRTYIRIVATMVIRVLRNPDGYLSEAGDDYSYRRDSAVSSGLLYVADSEVEQLRPPAARRRRGAFTITPAR